MLGACQASVRNRSVKTPGHAAARSGSAGFQCQGSKSAVWQAGIIGDAGEHVGEILLRVEAAELRRFDQRNKSRCPAAAGVGAGEQVIFAADRDAAQGPLGGIVVEGEPAVIEASQQRLPARPHIAERLGQFGFAGRASAGWSSPRRAAPRRSAWSASGVRLAAGRAASR